MQLIIALMLCLQEKPADQKEAPKDKEKPDLPWTFTLDGRYRYSDTLTRDPFDEPLASEILDRRDSAVDVEAALTHDFFKLGPVVASLGLGVRQVSWFKTEDFDLTFVNPSLTVMTIAPPVVFTQIVGVQYASAGGDPFAQSLYTVSALGVAPVPLVVTYSFSAKEYQVANPTIHEDRDGVEHTFLALATLSEKPLSFKLGFRASWVSTEGSDFDRVESGPLAILEYDLFWDTHWKADIRWTTHRYTHGNSLAPLEEHRSDGRAEILLKVRKPVLDELTVEASLEYRNYGSNLPAFDYDQLVARLGLELKF